MRRANLLILVLVLCAGITAIVGKQSLNSTSKASADRQLSVLTLLPKDGVISVHEPLVAKLQLKNVSKHNISIPSPTILSERVVVYDRSGKLIGATPIEPLPVDMVGGGSGELAPGESCVRWVVLSVLYQFTKPGNYRMRIQLLRPDESRSVMAETESRVRVLPFNPARLKARCEEIYAPLRSLPRDLRDFPMRTRLQALYSIRNDAVLPYLSLIAREWDKSSEQGPAMGSIRRIDTPKAKALLRSLAARHDHVGKVARSALKQPSGRDRFVDEWYVGDSWTRMAAKPPIRANRVPRTPAPQNAGQR